MLANEGDMLLTQQQYLMSCNVHHANLYNPNSNLDNEANKFYDRAHRLYDAAILSRCYTQHALRQYIDSEINHIRNFIKIQFVNKGLNSLTYPVYLKINILSLLFLLILKIRNPLSFVISIINLFVVLFLTITN